MSEKRLICRQCKLEKGQSSFPPLVGRSNISRVCHRCNTLKPDPAVDVYVSGRKPPITTPDDRSFRLVRTDAGIELEPYVIKSR